MIPNFPSTKQVWPKTPKYADKLYYTFKENPSVPETGPVTTGSSNLNDWVTAPSAGIPFLKKIPTDADLGKPESEFKLYLVAYGELSNKCSEVLEVICKPYRTPAPSINIDETEAVPGQTVDETTNTVYYTGANPVIHIKSYSWATTYRTLDFSDPKTSKIKLTSDEIENGIKIINWTDGLDPVPNGTTNQIKLYSFVTNAETSTPTDRTTYKDSEMGGIVTITVKKIGESKPDKPELTHLWYDGGTTPTYTIPSKISFNTQVHLCFKSNASLKGKAVDHVPTAADYTDLPAITLTKVGDDPAFTLKPEMIPVDKTEGWYIFVATNSAGDSEPLVVRFGLKGPDAPQINLTGGFIKNGDSEITVVNNGLDATFTFAPNATKFEWQADRDFADAPKDDAWQSEEVAEAGKFSFADGSNFANGRFFYRVAAPVNPDDASSALLSGDYGYIDINRLSAEPVASISEDPWADMEDGDLVQINEKLRVMGCYKTNDSKGMPYYIYLMNSDGAVIKAIANDITAPAAGAPADAVNAYNTLYSYRTLGAKDRAQADTPAPDKAVVVPAGGIIARINFVNNDPNMPQLYLSKPGAEAFDYMALQSAPVEEEAGAEGAFALSDKGLEKQYPENRTDESTKNDFNRYVELRSLTWTGVNNMVELADGAGSLSVYGARLNTPGYTFKPEDLTPGKMYRIKGFIGQADSKPAIFPIDVIDQCPGTPVLRAPNPVGEPEAGKEFTEVQAISDKVTFTVSGNANGETAFMYKIGENGEMQNAADKKIVVDLSEKADNDTTDLYVYGVLKDMTSLKPAMVRIIKRAATQVASIYDFKKAMFENMSANIYQLSPESKVLVEEITEKYLYVRDYDAANPAGIADDAEGYLRRLLIRNENGWKANIYDTDSVKERPIVVGDLISGFALKADERNGNMYSNSTGFARTFKYAGQDKDNAAKAEVREVNSLDANCTFTFKDTDRMRLLTLKDVTVSKSGSGTSADPFVYHLNLAGGAKAHMRIASPFTFRGGWQEAWAENAPFNITGVVLFDDDNSHNLAFAPLSFEGLRKLNTPAVYLSSIDESKRGDIEQPFTTGSIIMTKPETAPADAKIYYSTDGLDPLHSLASRKEYTGEIELDDETVEIRAFMAAPGYTPSDVVVRRFTKSSHDVQFILNFLQTAQVGQDIPLHRRHKGCCQRRRLHLCRRPRGPLSAYPAHRRLGGPDRHQARKLSQRIYRDIRC